MSSGGYNLGHMLPLRRTGIRGYVAADVAAALGPQIQGHHKAVFPGMIIQVLEDAAGLENRPLKGGGGG